LNYFKWSTPDEVTTRNTTAYCFWPTLYVDRPSVKFSRHRHVLVVQDDVWGPDLSHGNSNGVDTAVVVRIPRQQHVNPPLHPNTSATAIRNIPGRALYPCYIVFSCTRFVVRKTTEKLKTRKKFFLIFNTAKSTMPDNQQ